MSVVFPDRPSRADRHPAITYGEVLDLDHHDVPDDLREQQSPVYQDTRIPVGHYLDPAYFDQEVRHMWSRVWQVACREEQIPNTGDFIVYENVGKSLIVVRQGDGSIRALFNSCLHRGRKIVTGEGCRNRFTCPYHGVTWNRDGSFAHNPIAFDMPAWQDGGPPLPQAAVDRWGGWVFVNFDADAPPLLPLLGPMPAHFERWTPQDRYVALHVRKVVPCNWKLTVEAFMESHHAATTHPQILPYMMDVNSQYDQLSDHVTRQFSAQLVTSPLAGREYDEESIVRAMLGVGSRLQGALGDAALNLPEGVSARSHVSEIMRGLLKSEDGRDYSAFSDAEMVDSLLYNIFPNMSFWAGAMPTINYSWRPNGLDPMTSIMDVYMLRYPRAGEERPVQVTHDVGIDESFTDATGRTGMSNGLATILDQDMKNLPHVQAGLRSSQTGYLTLGTYTEFRILHLHRTIDAMIAAGQAAEA